MPIRTAQMVDAELRGSLHAAAQLDDEMSCLWPVCNYTTHPSWPGINITQAALSIQGQGSRSCVKCSTWCRKHTISLHYDYNSVGEALQLETSCVLWFHVHV